MGYEEDDRARRNRNRSWWQKRTKMERCTFCTLIIALIVILALIAAVAVIAHKLATKKKSESHCLTPACINTAAEVLKNLDQSVNPCDDFYQFACGGFIKNTDIPAHKAEVNQFSRLKDIVNSQLKIIFEEQPKPNEPKPLHLVKSLYKICMNTTAIETDGLRPIHKLLKDLGGWPALERQNWNENEFDWVKSTVQFRQRGLFSDNFITIGIDSDAKNSSRRIISLDQALMDLERENLLAGFDDEIIKAYNSYMIDLGVLFGVERSFAEYEVKNMLNFKMKLAEISLPEEQRHDPDALYNPMTIGELQRRHPRIPVLNLINNVLGRPEIALSSEDVINVKIPRYIADLENLLNRTPKRVQANYVYFLMISISADYLPEVIRKRDQQYMAMITGASDRPPRWSECIDSVANKLSIAVGVLYARSYFEESARQSAIEMVSNIRNEFIEIIKQLSWMDEQTKKEAIEKALGIEKHIAYPDEYLDDNILENYYSDLHFASNNYFEVKNEISLFSLNKSVEQLQDPINKTDWRTRSPSYDVNAGYAADENSIHLPAAILQGVFFNKDRPQYMNYGGIAYVIGHELTHGFDDQGKKYDKNGNLDNWWDGETDKSYAEKSKCFVEQYGQYTVPETGTKLNGKLTESENIADNGGIKEAYLAYNSWVRKNGEEPSLPGLKFTGKQTFWLSTANCWCAKERKESLANDILSDVHSPARYRVNVPLSNMEYFAKDFNCPSGTNMNPVKKCKVW